MASIVSLLSPSHEAGPCGYCKSGRSLLPEDYQALLDQGWRRSGNTLYLPDNLNTCCPQYTIRLPLTEFKLSKSMKKKWKHFCNAIGLESREKGTPFSCTWSKVKDSYVCLLSENFKMVLANAQTMEIDYTLFLKYQQDVHKDAPTRWSLKAYTNFLVDSPLLKPRIGHEGTYHLKYFFNDQLIAVSVLDILPQCLSSVYFYYDPQYASLSLGTISALLEMSLLNHLKASSPSLEYYYMGYYIHSCPKMKYKGHYSPSFLLNTKTHGWVLLDEALRQLLDHDKRHLGGILTPKNAINAIMDQVPFLLGEQLVPYKVVRNFVDDASLEEVLRSYVTLLNLPLAKRLVVDIFR